jgi:hypothetical protein
MTDPTVVELRVHGVSGTPPEELLDSKVVTQVAGSGVAGFYRPELIEERTDPRVEPGGEARAGAPLLEGYCWGGLTSGAASRAFWLLLLPFTLTNVAPRLRPLDGSGSGRPGPLVQVIWYVSRLLALAMTCLLVLSVAGVSLDLFAWQCGAAGDAARPDCSGAKPGWLMTPLLGLSVQHRLAVGALAPLLLMVVLWMLSKRTINNYEAVQVHVNQDDPDDDPDAVEPDLSSTWMWRNEQVVRRLRQLHLQISMAATLWIVLAPMQFAGRWLCYLVVLLDVGYILGMLAWPRYTGRRPSRRIMFVNLGIWGALGVAAAWCALELLFGSDVLSGSASNVLPGFSGTASTLFTVQCAAAFVFAALIAWAAVRDGGARKQARVLVRSGDADPALQAARAPLCGMSAAIVAVMALFLGAVFSSGVYVFAATWLISGSARPSYQEASQVGGTFRFPDIVLDANRAYTVSVAGLIAFLLVAGPVLLVRRAIRMRAYYGALESAYGPVDRDSPRARQVSKTFWGARQVDFAHRYLAILIVLGALISAFFVALLWTRSGRLCEWAHYPSPRGTLCATDGPEHGVLWTGALSAVFLQEAGAYLVITTLLGMVVIGTAAFRAAKTRRSVGILWDLCSFWPRAAHPFAAPCYAERTVPDLVTRISWYIDGEGAKSVVLAGHSQGTVISAATIFQLDALCPESAGKYGYLSFGCVLRRLYGRYFPVYFGAAGLDRLRGVLGGSDPIHGDSAARRWRNLWRYSDWLGGPVFTGPPPPIWSRPPGTPDGPDFEIDRVDHPLIDPAWDRPGGDTQYAKAMGHSDYWRDPVFPQAVATLAERLERP